MKEIISIVMLSLCFVSCGSSNYTTSGSTTTADNNYEIIKLDGGWDNPTLYIVKDKETNERYGATYSRPKVSDVSVSFIEDTQVTELQDQYTSLANSTLPVDQKYKQAIILSKQVYELAVDINTMKLKLETEYAGVK